MPWRNNLPSIVMLHYVSDEESLNCLKPWNISRAAYTQLLDYLEEERCKTIGFEDVLSGNRGEKEIIITFDDCPKHLWDFAIPELLKRKMKAVFYMPTAHIDGHNEWNAKDGLTKVDLMNESEIARLAEVGMEVGSHAHHHIMLKELNEDDAKEALVKSKTILEKIIGKDVLTIAYPYGSLPVKHQILAAEAGYKYGLGVFTPWENKYAIRRWIYDDTDTIATIKNKMSSEYRNSRAMRDKWDEYSKKIMRGAYKRYAALKNKLK